MKIITKKNEDRIEISFHGSFEAKVSNKLTVVIDQWINDFNEICFNFEKLEFIEESIIELILLKKKEMENRQKNFFFIKIPDQYIEDFIKDEIEELPEVEAKDVSEDRVDDHPDDEAENFFEDETGEFQKNEAEDISENGINDISEDQYSYENNESRKFTEVFDWIKSSHKFKKIIIGLLIIIITIPIVIRVFNYNDTKKDSNNRSENEINVEDIKIFKVEKKEISQTINILGQIVFYEKINISSKVNGRLKKIVIAVGNRVRKGQVIAQVEKLSLQISLKQQISELEISRKAYDLSKAKYENALKSVEIKLKTIKKSKVDLNDKRVSYENADRVLKNKEELLKIGGISESEYRSLKTQHTTMYTKYELALSDYEIQQVGYRDEDIRYTGLAIPSSEKGRVKVLKLINTRIERAELESAKSRIFQAKNNIRSTKILLNECDIRSPINGMVAAKNMEAGEMIKQDSVIATIIDISNVFISMNVNEKDIKRIHLNQKVNFTVDAMSGEKYAGTIKRITPILDVKTRTVEVKAIVSNRDRKLLPGMFARAVINVGEKKARILVPSSSIIKSTAKGIKNYLFILKKDSAFKQEILIGESFNDYVEVIKGLNSGDMIVSGGVNLIRPGLKIVK